MNQIILWSCMLFFGYSQPIFALNITFGETMKIAHKIWLNESGGKKSHLTCWNKGENFASMGIGHFIWYPAGENETFQQTFPSLLMFINSNGISLPDWLTQRTSCPWSNRDAFYADIDSPRMNELRDFLYHTRHLQAVFMAERLEKNLPLLISKLSDDQKDRVLTIFNRLEKDPKGVYALLDYFNFKGGGSQASETYCGQGWGLLQVLLAMPDKASSKEQLINDFVTAARHVLIRRVENSPPEKNEQRWLKGWLNRVDSYAK